MAEPLPPSPAKSLSATRFPLATRVSASVIVYRTLMAGVSRLCWTAPARCRCLGMGRTNQVRNYTAAWRGHLTRGQTQRTYHYR